MVQSNLMRYLIFFLFFVYSIQAYSQKHNVPTTSAIEVKGMVKKSLLLSIDKLSGFRQDSLGDVIIRNKHGEQKSISKQLKGILLKSIIDSAGIIVDKPKEYSEIGIILTASDGYKNVYSWNELFNTEIGNHVYVITQADGLPIAEMPDKILVLSLADINSGARHLKGLATIEIKKM